MSGTLANPSSLVEQDRSTALPAVGLGLAGTLLGAVAWAALAVATDMEVGYVAVLVGFLAGLGVKTGARGGGGDGLRAAAPALAVLGLVAAKYLTVAWFATRDTDRSLLDGQVVAVFVDNLGKLLSPFDALWIFLAVSTAWRTAAPAAPVAPAAAPGAPPGDASRS